MAEAKRWIVTYTKQIKQKRKVYQDGVLELHASTNKLLLYDDCDKLLECRILKRDEVISCGETLTFNAFLVDVNVAEGNHEPPTSSNMIGKGNRGGIEKNKIHMLNLSPSHKIIRDFKRREILKYEAIQQSKSPGIVKSNITEWEALYTTQITQKAAKYHDGFLHLSVRGSFDRQATLFDARKNNIVSRFIKKDEKIESGGTIAFDGYLVQIGEPQGDRNRSGENNSNVAGDNDEHGHKIYGYANNSLDKEFIKTGIQKNVKSHSSQDTIEPSATEWQALYTTQLTQKFKKYHDGFLKLAICGSHQRRAMLLDSAKTILHSRFLTKEEVIKSGVSFKFDAYLIDVGELEGHHATDSNNMDIFKKPEPGIQNSLASKLHALKGKSLSNACLRKNVGSNFSTSKADTKESSGRVPMNKPLRDASQILSFLQKPRIKNSKASCYTDFPAEANAMDLASVEDNPTLNPKSVVLSDQSSEIVDTTASRETIELEITTDSIPSKDFAALPAGKSNSQLTTDTHNGNSSQKLISDMEADSGCHDEGNGRNMPFNTPYGPVDVKNPSEDLSSSREMDEFPSFDLGF